MKKLLIAAFLIACNDTDADLDLSPDAGDVESNVTLPESPYADDLIPPINEVSTDTVRCKCRKDQHKHEMAKACQKH